VFEPFVYSREIRDRLTELQGETLYVIDVTAMTMGVIGLGQMDGGIAANLVRPGFEVLGRFAPSIWNELMEEE